MNSSGVLAGRRILVVDDDPDARELISTFLQSAGALVSTAGSAAEGLAALDRDWPDLLLADIAMPGEDGYAFMQKVRQLEAHRKTRIPAAAVTAYASEVDRKKALAGGFDSHIAKPVDPSQVIAAVQDLLQKSRAS